MNIEERFVYHCVTGSWTFQMMKGRAGHVYADPSLLAYGSLIGHDQ